MTVVRPSRAVQPPNRTTLRMLRVADAASLILLAIALSVTMFGGFRLAVFGKIVSAHSAARLWVAFAVLVAVRHLVVRRPTIVGTIDASARAFVRAESVRAVVPPFVCSRLTLLVVVYFIVVLFGFPKEPLFRISANEFVNLPARWDAGWYLGIAANGYRAEGHRGQQNVAFFPAYPMLMRVGGKLLGTDRLEYGVASGSEVIRQRDARLVWIGVFISTVALFWALCRLFGLTRAVGDSDQAAVAVTFCLAFPFAFIFSMPYTEALFLLVSVSAFDAMRRRKLVVAASWGLLAGLTRPNGFLLSIPLGLIGLGRTLARSMPRLAAAIDRLSPPAPDPPRRMPAALLAYAAVAVAPVVGMLAFSAYLYTLTGVPFGWAAVHASGWARSFIGFEPFLRPFRRMLFEQTLYDYTRADPMEVLNAAPFYLAVGLLIPIARRLGLAYGLIIPLMLFPPVAAGGWVSVGRFTSVLFPMFVYLGLAVRPAWRAPLAVSFAALQTLAAGLFFTWRQLY